MLEAFTLHLSFKSKLKWMLLSLLPFIAEEEWDLLVTSLRDFFIVFFSVWGGRKRFMPSSELEYSWNDCLFIFHAKSLFRHYDYISFSIKCLIHTNKRRCCQFENYLQTDGVFNNGMMIGIALIRKAFRRCRVSGDGFPDVANGSRWFAEDPKAIPN